MRMIIGGTGPHAGQPVAPGRNRARTGASAMVLVHGRGDTASGILQLVTALPMAGMAYVAPQASGQTWYPNRFLAPMVRRTSHGSHPRSRAWGTCSAGS